MKRQAILIGALAALGALGVASAAGGALAGKAPPDVTPSILPAMNAVYVGKKMVYNVLVKNVGGTDATGVSVEIDVSGADPRMFKLDATKLSCTYASDTQIVCSGMLAHGKTAKIRIGIRPHESGPMQLTAFATSTDDAQPGNSGAADLTPVHPGKAGPPKVRNEDGPYGGIDVAGDHAAVSGRLSVSEAANVTVNVVDLTAGTTLPMQPGSVVADVPAHGSEAHVEVGDGKHAESAIEAPKVTYDIELPKSEVKLDHVYAVVAKAVDGDGEQSDVKQVAFKPKKK